MRGKAGKAGKAGTTGKASVTGVPVFIGRVAVCEQQWLALAAGPIAPTPRAEAALCFM